ncbi:MAG TPA: UvrD-helicase domain-containing protein, partial [Solirubrobacteraceae bacterium]|nr:UvrD-helicase domain-containing protein [Solirubrobacteraceae bacterium]
MSALERSEAVRHQDGPLVLTGAAGTGKTRLIGDRFLWLVQQGTEPSRIAVVAPSRGRAQALRERLESELTRGYEELLSGTPVELAAAVIDRTGTGTGGSESLMALLGPGDRLAMLMERLDQLELSHHDFGGSPATLLGQFVRRIDCLKAELISAEEFGAWAASLDGPDGQLEREFAGIYA